MKKILLSAALLCATCGVMAQSITSYFMPDAIERRNLNVALAPERGFFAIPLVGATNFDVVGNLSVSSLIYEKNGGLVTLMDSAVSAATALDNLSERANFTGLSNRLTVLSFGAYCRDHKSFWSFDLSARTSANIGLPYEFFQFVKQGREGNMKDINIYAESYIDASVGYSRSVNDKLTVGGRLKFLVGLANASMEVTNFDVKMNVDEWSVDAAGEVNIYGPGLAYDGNIGDDFDFNNIGMEGFSPAGYGVAVDLGAEYKINDNLKVSLAANDLGFISWSEKCNVSATMAASQTFTGIEVDGGSSTAVDFNFDDMSFDSAEAKSTARFLQANIIAGAEYKFLDELIGVGGLYTMNFWKAKTMHNLVASANIRPISWFTLATSYAFINNRGHSLGLALNLSPSWFNLYLATDVLLSKKSAQYVPINQSMMNVSLGLAIPLGKRSLRSKYTKL